jgi:hypothetical protein
MIDKIYDRLAASHSEYGNSPLKNDSLPETAYSAFSHRLRICAPSYSDTDQAPLSITPPARMPAMIRRSLVSLIAAVSLVTIVPQAQAEVLGAMGRYLGVGWGDGFHSRAACPPRRHSGFNPYGPYYPGTLPWWTVPQEAEPLPHPAAQTPTTSRATPPAGPSLFRQAGEGSSGEPTPATINR